MTTTTKKLDKNTVFAAAAVAFASIEEAEYAAAEAAAEASSTFEDLAKVSGSGLVQLMIGVEPVTIAIRKVRGQYTARRLTAATADA